MYFYKLKNDFLFYKIKKMGKKDKSEYTPEQLLEYNEKKEAGVLEQYSESDEDRTEENYQSNMLYENEFFFQDKIFDAYDILQEMNIPIFHNIKHKDFLNFIYTNLSDQNV